MTYKRKEVISGCDVSFVGGVRQVSVYCVKADDTSKPVYVGSTSQVLKHRIRGHVLDARKGSDLPFHVWLRGRQSFHVEVLETVDEAERAPAETKWVATFEGLLNVTNGGPGLSGHRFNGTEHAAKIADKLKRGSNCTCEVCFTVFWRKPRDIKRGHSRFCSMDCYQAWQRGKPKSNEKGLMGIAGRKVIAANRELAS